MVTYVGATTSASSTAPTLPAHNSGDLIVLYLCGKPDTIADVAYTGFTYLGKYTGGTGSQGADTGATFIQVFVKVGDGTTTAPSGSGGAGLNTSTIGVIVLRPDSGYVWRDAVADIAVVSGSDTDASGAGLQATTNTFTSGEEPDGANGDAMVLIGSIPTDSGSTPDSVNASATGLSGGTHTSRTYSESAGGNDCAHSGATWMGFTGTPSTGIAIDHQYGGISNETGTVAAVAIRQSASGFTMLPPAATATADAYAPTFAFTNPFAVSAPTATATADALVPAFLFGGIPLVFTPPTASSTATAYAPSVSFAAAGLSFAPTPAVAILAALPPTFDFPPPIDPTPARYQNILAMDTARAVELTGIGPAGQPLITTETKTTPRARDRILLGGKDITYFRGVKTPTPDFTLIKPLLWGSGTLVLPQVNPQYDRLGDAATDPVLEQVKPDTLVQVQRVLDGAIVATDYVCFVDAVNTNGSELTLSLGGHGSGRASHDIEPAPVFRKKHDLKFQILNYLRTLNLRTADDGDGIGIPIYDRGAVDGLTLVNEMVALAVTRSGIQYDVMPTTGRVFDVVATDRATIHATVYLDDSLAKQRLDNLPGDNIVYATGRTASGQVVNNAKAPGLQQYSPPFFAPMELGDTGGSIPALHNQLTIAGYLNYGDVDDVDVFDEDTEDAVSEFQDQAGLSVTGVVNEATWNALWDLTVIGYSIDQARIFPMAQRSYTREWNFGGNGAKISRNADWDPHRIKRAVSIDVGSGFNRRRIRRFARSRLAPDQSNWQGTLSLTSGVIIGEHTPGDPITADDVMPARALRPGMNIWLPLFDGGTLFHIATVDVRDDGSQVELHIDTQARDSIPLWEVIERNRETRSSVARRVSGQVRRSQVQQDTIAEWTDICGNLPAQTPLTGNQWNKIMVPAGQEGIINRTRLQLADPLPFAVLLTQQEIPGGPPVTTPLTDPRPSLRPWWERPAIVDVLRQYGYLAAWGTPDQPCGYDPGLKTDDQGATGDDPTGLFYDESPMDYSCAEPGRLYLYIWVEEDTALEAGLLLRQQLTGA